MRGELHYIEQDLAGALRPAWIAAVCDWIVFTRWVRIWA